MQNIPILYLYKVYYRQYCHQNFKAFNEYPTGHFPDKSNTSPPNIN